MSENYGRTYVNQKYCRIIHFRNQLAASSDKKCALMFTNPLFVFYHLADFLFKFLVIGSAGTGKSCILHQFIEGKCKLPMPFCVK